MGGFGHIMPTRDISHLDKELFQKIISLSGAVAIYIDGKSMSGKEERMIASFAGQYNVPVIGQGDLMKMKNLSFSDYMTISTMASSLVEGSSTVIHNIKFVKNLVAVSIPGGLIDEVMKVASEEFFSALMSMPVIHLTGRGKACHPVFITDAAFSPRITDELIHLCVILLQDRYTCSFDGDFLIISKSRFDPARAKSFGIPPGPLYSELMAGKPVKSGDLLVYPEMVMTETEKRIYVPQRQAR